MPKKIENKDIFSPDFLEPQKKSFRELIELIKSVEKEMKDVLKVQQESVKNPDKKTTEGLKKRKRAITSINQVSKELLKLEKQRKTASAQLAIAETQEAKAVAGTRIELAKKKKAVKDEILAEKGLVSEYQKQSAKLNDLRKKYKDLILVQGKETRATKKLRKEISSLDNKLKKVDASVGQFQRSVGNYGKAFGKLSGVLSRFGLAVGGLAIIRNITGIVRNFEQSQADLASVLADATIPQLKALEEQARELGATTRFTAGEVAGLQKEFAKLGFDPSEIANMTEATLSLAAATGTELAEAASVAGGVMNAFGLDSSQTQRAVDVMASSFSKSALDMEKFKETMKTAAPIAKATGVSLEQATAAAGKLADANISGSKAGTDLKNIFSALIKDGKPLEQSLEDIATQLESASTKAEKLAIAEDLVGERAKGSLLVLVDQRKALDQLQIGLENSGGAAKEMADKQLDTLNGQLDLLKSAWEGFILDLESGTGVFSGLKDVIGFVARNLKEIIGVIGTVVKLYLSYKLAVIAINTVQKIQNSNLLKLAKNFKFASKAAKANTKATKDSAAATKKFNANMISLLATAAITFLVNLASAWYDVASGARNARLQAAAFRKAEEKGAEKGNEQITERRKVMDQELLDAKQRAVELGLTEKQALEQRQKIQKKFILEEKRQIAILQSKKKTLVQNTTILELAETKATALANAGQTDGFNRIMDQSEKSVKLLAKSLKELGLEAIVPEESALVTEGSFKRMSRAGRAGMKEIDSEVEVLQGNLRDLDVELQELDIDKLEIKDFSIDPKIKLDKLKKAKELIDQLKQDAADATQVIGQQEQEQLKESIRLQEIAAEKELQIQLDLASKTPELVNVDKLETLLNQRFDLIKRALEDERDLMLLNEDLTIEERELIAIEFNNQLAENERNRVNTIDDSNDEIIEAQIQTSEARAEIERKAREDEAKAEEEARKKRKQDQKDQLDALREFAEKAIQIANAKTDKEIENIDKEIEASKKREDQLQQLATQGNLTADQSVGAEIKRQAELEKQKEELEKKKVRRQLILQGLELLSSKIDQGDKNPVVGAINDMTILLGALSSLPGFIDGTETTVGAALGKPQLNTGTDDYIVRVDGAEKILNPGMSARTGNMTTEEITRAAEMYSNGMFDSNVLIQPKIAQLNTPFQDQTQILKKFDSLESTIRNKPILSDLKFNELTKALIVTVEQNGDLKRTHYKLK